MTLTLEDRLELLMLPGRYGNAIDDRDWAALREMFTEDATFEVRVMGLRLEGREAIVEFMDTTEAHPLGHFMTNVAIDHEGSTTTLRFRAIFPILNPDGPDGPYRIAFVCYYDEVVKTEGRWRVRHRLVTRAPKDMQPTATDRRLGRGLAQLLGADWAEPS